MNKMKNTKVKKPHHRFCINVSLFAIAMLPLYENVLHTLNKIGKRLYEDLFACKCMARVLCLNLILQQWEWLLCVLNCSYMLNYYETTTQNVKCIINSQ